MVIDPQTEDLVMMIRRTRVEDLVMMGGNYPLDLAVVALEQCHDNLEVTAVWLLDRFFENALRFTAQNSDNVDDDIKDGGGDDEADIYDENGRINLMLWLNTDLDDPDDEIDAQLPVGLCIIRNYT